MTFRDFCNVQKVIDDLVINKKRPPRHLKELIDVPEAKDFLICKKLNIIELYKFCGLLQFIVDKKIMISYLNSLKYRAIGIDFPFKLPIVFLQKVCDFIEDHKHLINDAEYKTDLEYLMSFY